MADEANANGEHTHESAAPAVPVVTPVVEAGGELISPVVDHAAKIAAIEERESQRQVEHARELAELEERLRHATGSQFDSILERIAGIEQKMAAAAEGAAEDVADTAAEGVELAVPEVEASPAPPEKVRQGLRHRRKARRKGKS